MPLVTSFTWRYGLNNSNPPGYDEQFEANSQDHKVGELVRAASGFIGKRAAATDLILGIADRDGANDAAAQTKGLKSRYQLIQPNAVYMASVSAAGAATTSAQTDMYSSFGVIESSVEADKWTVNKSDTTNKRVTIIGLVDPAGTTHGRVLVQFIAAQIQSIVAL